MTVKVALPALVDWDGRAAAEAGVDVDAPIYSGPPIDAELAVFDSDSTVAVADEEAEESRGRRPVGRAAAGRRVLVEGRRGACRGGIG